MEKIDAVNIESVNFENNEIGLCVICNNQVFQGRLTCSDNCHDEFVKLCEKEFGIFKKVTDAVSGISYKVPTRDIIEKGLKWEDLITYPIWEDEIGEECVLKYAEIYHKTREN